ncbi:hypothetical protein KFK09_002557 [Dendrobium nobile]|uniref:Uncharacterized protein n=1 Tax=Dendrobium nobile TaxID=94219 RepID=A0A8T3C1P4_DENNO|nr:hypothetical protein KFK09_002557 [Dendrobium nobile]
MEMPLLPLREQDTIERDLELLIEGSDMTNNYSEKAKWEKLMSRNWIFYPIAITVVVFIFTAVVSLCKSTKLKK